jgi:hypothetical protein
MLHPVGTRLFLARANLVAKLVFELQLSVFLDMLELHAFKRAVILVCHELGFKKLSDRLESVSSFLPAVMNLLWSFLWNDMENHLSASASKGFDQSPAARSLAI